MAKELPYFQFEPAEYLTKDISFCSLSSQGLFINICSYYWQRKCSLTKSQLLRRFNNNDEFDELINEGVIDLKDGEETIVIKFLDEQYKNATKLSIKNSINGAKGGRPKNPIKTQKEPNGFKLKTQSKGIREDKSKEEENKEDKFNTPPPGEKIDFKELLDFINQQTGRKFQTINKNLKEKFRCRLRDGYKKKQITLAIKNAVKEKTHRESGNRWLTPEFFTRASTIDKYGFDSAEVKVSPSKENESDQRYKKIPIG